MMAKDERDPKIPASVIERPEFAAACAGCDMGKVFELSIRHGLSKNAMTRMTEVRPDHIRQVTQSYSQGPFE